MIREALSHRMQLRSGNRLVEKMAENDKGFETGVRRQVRDVYQKNAYREKYLRRRLVSDQALLDLVAAGKSKQAAWFAFCDMTKFRHPRRPKLRPVHHRMNVVWARIDAVRGDAPWMEKLKKVITSANWAQVDREGAAVQRAKLVRWSKGRRAVKAVTQLKTGGDRLKPLKFAPVPAKLLSQKLDGFTGQSELDRCTEYYYRKAVQAMEDDHKLCMYNAVSKVVNHARGGALAHEA